jgi:single-strand DNA-binding protein
VFRQTPKGTPVCTFSLASNRFFRQDSGLEKEVSFFDVETWARLAEACSNKGKKGRGVRVVGRLKQDRWTGNDGTPRSRITIVAEHVEFRPEFRKDEKPAAEVLSAATPADELAEQAQEFYDAVPFPGNGGYAGGHAESNPAMADELPEAVAF